MYYDTIKDPIRRYFLEKIQICVSTEAALNVLSKPSPNNGKEARRQSTDTDSSSEEQDEVAELE